MIKKIGIVLFFAAFVGAGHVLPLQAQQPQTECPPECTIDTMEIVTWYPSPWNAYDELRSNRIVVGGGDAEKDPLPPPWGTIAFKPLSAAPQNTSDGTISDGTMYYDSSASQHKFKYFNGSDWQDLGGGEIQLAQYDFSTSKPACNSGKTGLMVFDSNSNRPYVCDKNGVWLTSSWTDKDLGMALHSSTQCTSAGGTVVDDGTGNKFCKIPAGGCPSGWMQYSNWTTTQNSQCQKCEDLYSCCSPDYANSGSHNWANSPVENIAYTVKLYKNGGHCQSETRYCQASVAAIGCY